MKRKTGLQNIPVRTNLGRVVRDVLIGSHVFAETNYATVEMRIMATEEILKNEKLPKLVPLHLPTVNALLAEARVMAKEALDNSEDMHDLNRWEGTCHWLEQKLSSKLEIGE